MTARILTQAFLGLALTSTLFAQAGGRGTISNGAPATSPSLGRNTNTPTNTQTTNPQPSTSPDFQRPIYISGRVALDDGTPPPDSVVLQLACSGNPRSVGYTDSKGRFSIDLGNHNNMAGLMDATQSGYPGSGSYGGNGNMGGSASGLGSRTSTTGTNTQGNMLGERNLIGCELVASLAGFRSDRVNLGNRRALDSPEVGTIVLHRLANVEGYTVSATTALAPKDARKAFDKGREDEKKGKWDNAEKQFQKAVDSYPKYAVAWYELGFAQEQQKNVAEAKKSYQQALAADSRLVNPYHQLALIAVSENKWEEVAATTDRLVRLDPVDFPDAWFYNALANYRLEKLDIAERAAREGLKADSDHRVANMEHLLGAILYDRMDYPGAAEHLKAYLKTSPDAPDAEKVKTQVADLEKALQAAKK